MDPVAVTLEWMRGTNAIVHDVYFGTSADDVAARAGDTFKGSQPNADFDPGPLAEGTTYYWRVDEAATGDVKHTGEVWNFTTHGPGGGLEGEYFSNPNLESDPVLVRVEL